VCVTHSKRVREKQREREREAYTQREAKREREKHNTHKDKERVSHTEQQCYTHNDVNRYGVNIYQLDTGWG